MRTRKAFGSSSPTSTTVERQYDIYIDRISHRRRNPVTKLTLLCYDCFWRTWIYPSIGHMEVSQIRNLEMKKLVAKLMEAGLAPSTIASVTQVVKGIVGSAIDENGDEMYPVKWNTEFINAPHRATLCHNGRC
jgi:hypothetical protein